MSIDYFLLKRKLKKEHSYLSIQQELSCYRKAGIEEYTFLSNGYDVCNSLNGKSFPLKDAKVGINLPPMHPGCRCTIVAKSKIDLFKERNGENPLQNNPKFEEWKQKYLNNSN